VLVNPPPPFIMPHIYDHPRPSVACETVVFDLHNIPTPQVLLVLRKKDPFKGLWSLPGGFLEEDEELEECASRELYEETGVDIEARYLHQAFTVGNKNRDPRGRIIAVVYTAVVDNAEYPLCAGDDAAEVAWFRMDELPSLAADHLETIRRTLGEVYNDPI
jgi:8-oxo-dGTP diphosphatase